jgi:hypothetical protein
MNGFICAPKFNHAADLSNPDPSNPAMCVADGPANPRRKKPGEKTYSTPQPGDPDYKTPTHKCDATGAFQLGANQFQRIHGLAAPLIFDNTKPNADCRKAILDGIRAATGPLDVVAYFGHGVSYGLPTGGFYTSDLDSLADGIRANAARGVVVLLYACDAGATLGFASQLADKLSNIAAVVYGHNPPPGHSYANPAMKRFPGDEWVVPLSVLGKNNPLWGPWRAGIAKDLWARFPFMSEMDLLNELTPTVSGAAAPANLLGRWGVQTDSGAWNYVFTADQYVYCTDATNKNKVAFVGRWWKPAGQTAKMFVAWNTRTVEEWPLPLNTTKENAQVLLGGYTLSKVARAAVQDPADGRLNMTSPQLDPLVCQ